MTNCINCEFYEKPCIDCKYYRFGPLYEPECIECDNGSKFELNNNIKIHCPYTCEKNLDYYTPNESDTIYDDD